MPAYGATDRVRRKAVTEYIEPARKSGATRVRIHSGTFNKSLVANHILPANRLPLVCNALSSRKFQSENHLTLEKVEGPPSGRSSTVVYTYRLQPVPAESTTPPAEGYVDFLSLRGIMKETYKKLGGAEKFHQAERDAWGE